MEFTYLEGSACWQGVNFAALGSQSIMVDIETETETEGKQRKMETLKKKIVKERDTSRVINQKGNISRNNNKSMVQKSSSPVKIPEWSKNSNNKKSRRVSTITEGSSSSSVAATSDGYYGNVNSIINDYGATT
ncbi:hypothetical protein RND71_033341 [Anisodus tanguticus]|uniref:Uncharacterized protein n=1 Tax=Anisodus tanguticus TaxID=243964 RepID=A0AAE1UXE2_9SOLA|nr:hypothetical protein RND71_033341 [Anisodus tanguticus]